jgi:hypothetical protein
MYIRSTIASASDHSSCPVLDNAWPAYPERQSESEVEGCVQRAALSTNNEVALFCRSLLLARQGLTSQSVTEQLEPSRPSILVLRGFSRKTAAAIRSRRALTPGLEQEASIPGTPIA